MENMRIGEVRVEFEGNYAHCYRNAGSVYGGIRETIVDCTGIADDKIRDHVAEYAGKIYGEYLD